MFLPLESVTARVLPTFSASTMASLTVTSVFRLCGSQSNAERSGATQMTAATASGARRDRCRYRRWHIVMGSSVSPGSESEHIFRYTGRTLCHKAFLRRSAGVSRTRPEKVCLWDPADSVHATRAQPVMRTGPPSRLRESRLQRRNESVWSSYFSLFSSSSGSDGI